MGKIIRPGMTLILFGAIGGALTGGIIGGTLGVQVIKVLRHLGEADFVITVVYVLMLGGVGSYMFFESLTALRGRTPRSTPRASSSPPTPDRPGRPPTAASLF